MKEKPNNPKDLVGALKPDFSLIPMAAKIHMSLGLMYGNVKYDVAYNWRDENKKIGIMGYISAAERHMDLFKDGEDFSDDGLVHHLGHAMDCLAIVLDALENGYAIDNRPPKGKASELMNKYSDMIKSKLMPKWKEEKQKMLNSRTLSKRDSLTFAENIINPPEPNEELKKLLNGEDDE